MFKKATDGNEVVPGDKKTQTNQSRHLRHGLLTYATLLKIAIAHLKYEATEVLMHSG